jgi:hypothetical protein
MSRQKGTPNKPKVEKLAASQVGVTFTEKQKETIKEIVSKQGTEIRLINSKYIIVKSNDNFDLEDMVIAEIEQSYVCQGGVSVTNYRADNGNIVMVYCQGMIRKE